MYFLFSDGYKSLDVDSLLSENRFLKESLEHAKEEKELANSDFTEEQAKFKGHLFQFQGKIFYGFSKY